MPPLPPIADDEAYALLQELWQAQDADALARGSLEVPDAWCSRLAAALVGGQERVHRIGVESADGVLRVVATVATPFGVIDARVGVAPEVLRIDPAERRAVLRIAEPLTFEGGGMLGGLMGLLGGSADALAAKFLGGLPGVTLEGDRAEVDLTRIARVEALCQRSFWGRPLCHYLQIVGCTVGTGRLAAHWRTGLDVPAAG